MDRLLINMGLCYNQLKNYTDAKKFINQGFETCGDDCNEQIKIEGEYGLGISHYGLSNFEEGEKHFNESLKISRKIDNKRFQAENLISRVVRLF